MRGLAAALTVLPAFLGQNVLAINLNVGDEGGLESMSSYGTH